MKYETIEEFDLAFNTYYRRSTLPYSIMQMLRRTPSEMKSFLERYDISGYLDNMRFERGYLAEFLYLLFNNYFECDIAVHDHGDMGFYLDVTNIRPTTKMAMIQL